VIATAQVITSNSQNLTGIIPGRILIVQSITPSWLPLLKQAAAVVTEQGGMTSHAAIIARELGIPAVVGAIGVTQLFETGESLLVDGDQGEIHRVKDPNREVERSRPVMSYSPLPPIATQLLVNLSQVNSLEKIIDLPVDGVGLLRSELIMLNALENLHPNEWLRQGNKSELVTRLAQLIIQFAAAFAPRPVLYRSMDWREAELAPPASHEFPFLSGVAPPSEPEVNPIVGLRGTLRYLIDPTLFDLELAALKQVQAYGYSNVQLMLPFIRAVEEFTFCRRRVEQAGLTENPHFQLWIMAEVPSVLFLLPDYVKAGVQGISIGTNDLTQLLLAVDRDQERLGSTLDARHPAVRRALQQLIQMARQAGIPCSICGQAPAQYPELIDALVEWGITSISVDVNDVERIYNAIARAEQRLLLEAARQKMNN
jgi:pyruvate,water dikinase